MWWTRLRQLAHVTAEEEGVCGALSIASLRQEGPLRPGLTGSEYLRSQKFQEVKIFGHPFASRCPAPETEPGE